MAVAIRLPDMGTNVEECKLLGWRVQEGQSVKRGEILADIETDKAVAELESTAEGVLLRQTVKTGERAHTGDVLAYVGSPGEQVPDQSSASPSVQSGEPAFTVSPSSPDTITPGATPRVSTVVRNLAAKLNVNLANIQGSGAGGMITREDVLSANRAGLGRSQRGENLSRRQAAVARAVSNSWREIPHLYVTATFDMTSAARLRAERSAAGQISYDAILLKAIARTIEAVPLMAAKLEGDKLVRADGIHIALAIGFDNELLLPVIRDVNRKDLQFLQEEISLLASNVRSDALRQDQLSGACMALSNLGMYPVDSFEGIIFPGHNSILTVGKAQKAPVVVGDRVETRPLMRAVLGADHRIINGRTAAEFLSKLKKVIESGDLG